MSENFVKFSVDSTLIANKFEIDLVDCNIQLHKHKSCKISIIADDFNVLIHYKLTNSNNHDVIVFYEQISEMSIKFLQLCANNKKFIADVAYNSLKLKIYQGCV
jgi:hypothetical protein